LEYTAGHTHTHTHTHTHFNKSSDTAHGTTMHVNVQSHDIHDYNLKTENVSKDCTCVKRIVCKGVCVCMCVTVM